MKHIFLLIAFVAGNFLYVNAQVIEWKEKIVVHDQPSLNGDTTKGPSFRRTYGSEYGRMVKLHNGKWLAGYTISRNDGYQKDPNGGFELEIAESADNGRTWKKVAVLSDPGRDLDNVQMLQLQDHSILLACRSVRWQESYRLPVYISKDNGSNWKKISTIDSNEGAAGALGKPDKGVYEPHFHLLDDGRVAVMYANEKHVTDSVPYSQIISQKISADKGNSWGPEIWVAYEQGHGSSRPGMPVWTKMKNGKYIVVYEICGPESCNVYYKISSNGIAWPQGLGNLIKDQTGGPYIASLSNGMQVVTSNRGNISVSKDFGASWNTTERAWEHERDFSKDWHQTVWSSIYETKPDEVAVMTSVQRAGGGHNIQIRFGKINMSGPPANKK